jgi:lipopolysaccharide transport system permease protein
MGASTRLRPKSTAKVAKANPAPRRTIGERGCKSRARAPRVDPLLSHHMTATGIEMSLQRPGSSSSSGAGAKLKEFVIEPRKGWIGIDWSELWEGRELLYFLVLREIMVRYKQTVLGVAWAALQPLFTMVIFTVIFGTIAKIPSDGQPYALFVFAGLLPWTFFQNSVTSAAQSLVNQQALLTKIYLPRAFIPASSVGAGLIDLLISFGIFACLMLVYRVTPGWGLLALPGLVLISAIAALGVGLALAAMIVSYRDVRHIVPFLMQCWLYISPVVYPVTVVPDHWRPWLALNPMAGLIDGYRSALLGTPWKLEPLLISSASALVFLVYGLFYFRRVERRFADVA